MKLIKTITLILFFIFLHCSIVNLCNNDEVFFVYLYLLILDGLICFITHYIDKQICKIEEPKAQKQTEFTANPSKNTPHTEEPKDILDEEKKDFEFKKSQDLEDEEDEKDIISVNSIVTIFDKDLNEISTYKIVQEKPGLDEISYSCALAKAIIGHSCGETIMVKAEVEYEIQIVGVDNSDIKPHPIPSGEKLVYNLYKGYGTRAQDIYIDCCKKFNWDYTKRGLFAPQHSLYAKWATPEKYAVLFLAHSNLSNSKGGHWQNTIKDDIIEEEWDMCGDDFYNDTCTRVVFAKSKFCNGNYIFIGVYKPVVHRKKILFNGQTVWIKTFRLISNTYPNKNA